MDVGWREQKNDLALANSVEVLNKQASSKTLDMYPGIEVERNINYQ